MAAAERNGRTYIAVTLRTQDLGQNCNDTIALFDYAFNNFDTIDVNGVKMTVPKGVTAADLTTQSFERNGNTFDQYYYNGQFVGYAPAAAATPTAAVTAAAETVSPEGETQAADGAVQTAETGETSESQETQETESAVQNAEEEQ